MKNFDQLQDSFVKCLAGSLDKITTGGLPKGRPLLVMKRQTHFYGIHQCFPQIELDLKPKS